MTDVLSDSLAEKIAHLLVMALSPSATPGERENAARLFWQTLESADPGAHALSERLHLPVASDEEMQKVFDAGREHEAGQSRAVAVTPKPFFASGVAAKRLQSRFRRPRSNCRQRDIQRVSARRNRAALRRQLASHSRQASQLPRGHGRQACSLRRHHLGRAGEISRQSVQAVSRRAKGFCPANPTQSRVDAFLSRVMGKPAGHARQSGFCARRDREPSTNMGRGCASAGGNVQRGWWHRRARCAGGLFPRFLACRRRMPDIELAERSGETRGFHDRRHVSCRLNAMGAGSRSRVA